MSEHNIDAKSPVSELIVRAEKAARNVIEMFKNRSLTLALAESCTAGLISNMLAEIPGASGVLWGSFVCYTRQAKILMLGLNEKELDAYGLVSRETACSMAKGALHKSGANFGVSVTGIAGPDGDGSCVPVGTVWTAFSQNNSKELYSSLESYDSVKSYDLITSQMFLFNGSRNAVRVCAAIAALESILKIQA